MINPYVILGAFAAFILATSGAYVAGRRDGQRIEASQEAAIAAKVQEAGELAAQKAADAISQIEVKNVTIRQRTEKEIEKVELTKLRIVAFILIIALTMIEMTYDR